MSQFSFHNILDRTKNTAIPIKKPIIIQNEFSNSVVNTVEIAKTKDDNRQMI